MEKKIKVGVKYCGNCNPYIDTQQLFSILQNELQDEIIFTHWEKKPYDALLILSGCPADCAKRPQFSGPGIVVAGKTVDSFPIPEEQLPQVVKQKILSLEQG
ncbi:MAG: hypothetical protein PWQ37_2664 [Candidatus Petromonas sp.]|jgi:dissimilatory sulfite reductase (desulfoviridin) alpha/beta subunit|nr:hypothetical protein [Candidatus Petromonas sp.]